MKKKIEICLHAKFNINQQKQNKFLPLTPFTLLPMEKNQSVYIIDHEENRTAREWPITKVTETVLHTKLQEIF